MAFDTTGVMAGQRIHAQHVQDLYNALTGVMVDQPLYIANNLTVTGTFQSSSTVFQSGGINKVALSAKGTASQGTSIFEVRDYTDALLLAVNKGGTILQANMLNPLASGGQTTNGTIGGPIMAAQFLGAAGVISGTTSVAYGTVNATTNTLPAPTSQRMIRYIAAIPSGSITVNTPSGSIHLGTATPGTSQIANWGTAWWLFADGTAWWAA